MKTGIELIAEERQEQIEKHGWTAEHDSDHIDGDLKDAALFALTKSIKYHQLGFDRFEKKVRRKLYKERLIIAGALIAAEIDRIIK